MHKFDLVKLSTLTLAVCATQTLAVGTTAGRRRRDYWLGDGSRCGGATGAEVPARSPD